jgi:putative hydrolase of the HAD superfamily
MPQAAFSHVTHWVFDLDNTLYPPSARLFDQIEGRMRAYLMRVLNVNDTEADHLRRHYWETYGTTLAGLMREHQVDPDPFLDDVHDISFDQLQPDPTLAGLIRALPGRRIVYTNGTRPYAKQVLAARGLDGIFDAIYGVEHAEYLPKPEQGAYDRVFGTDNLNGGVAAMFEDEARNLAVPFSMGMRTVHVAPAPQDLHYVDFHTDDLNGFLGQILGQVQG